VSIAANIAEARARKQRFLQSVFARGAGVLERAGNAFVSRAAREFGINAGSRTDLRKCDELGRMVRSLIRSIQRKQANATN
jgi:hypothetical protein